jgi:hypothetical protein
MLRILQEGGVPPKLAGNAVDMLALFVASSTYEDAIRRRLIPTAEDAETYIEQVRAYFQSLPADRFPTLIAMAGTLTTFDGDEDAAFEFALDVHIRGLTALAAEARAGA